MGRKMDRYKIATKQYYELQYVADKFGINVDMVKEAIKKAGSKSRRKVYKWIRDNYEIAEDNGTFDNITLETSIPATGDQDESR